MFGYLPGLIGHRDRSLRSSFCSSICRAFVAGQTGCWQMCNIYIRSGHICVKSNYRRAGRARKRLNSHTYHVTPIHCHSLGYGHDFGSQNPPFRPISYSQASCQEKGMKRRRKTTLFDDVSRTLCTIYRRKSFRDYLFTSPILIQDVNCPFPVIL